MLLKLPPPSTRESVIKRPSVLKRLIPHTAGSISTIPSLSQKQSQVSNGVQSDRKRVKFDKNLNSQSETKVSSNTSFEIPQLEVKHPALANLVQNGDISVKSLSDKGDKLDLFQHPAFSKYTPCLLEFTNFAQSFNHDNLEIVADLSH